MKPGVAPVSVLLVDDHAVVREGYRRLLERSPDISVAGEAASAADAYQAFCRLAPDIVVMDISLPDVSGIEAMRRMRAREPRARVLMFSMHEEPVFARRALDAGASGYITKASAPEVLVEAVRAVVQGKAYLSSDIARDLALGGGLDPGAEAVQRKLSHREFEIMRLLVAGYSLGAIAERLGLSYKTVANHQSAIRHKLGAETALQLLQIAGRMGIVAERPAT